MKDFGVVGGWFRGEWRKIPSVSLNFVIFEDESNLWSGGTCSRYVLMHKGMMLSFFGLECEGSSQVFVVRHREAFLPEELEALEWLFGGAKQVSPTDLGDGFYVGPRAEMVSPWSTTATEITHNMGLGKRAGVDRVEFFQEVKEETPYDKMLLRKYRGLSDRIFDTTGVPEAIVEVHDLRSYSQAEGLALSDEEIDYLEGVALELGRPLTDSEVFGFSQVNSEHCRHKIFGGTFVIDGVEQEESLFGMIKKTSREHPNQLISAYKDNVAFVHGPTVQMFAPKSADRADFFHEKEVETALSLKAETHNFPTTVEPFNGAATGTGGEIRDRLAGGKSSIPMAGTAVYMTPYTRLQGEKKWEQAISARPWLYQTPQELLTKASNGASDFGNKFGQPLITGSVLTFEHQEGERTWGYDKVIMLAGGVGYTSKRDAKKGEAKPGDRIVVMGGDNYRIGMGGGAVSSVNTGLFEEAIELNAVQRSNPEMQKRVSNVIRALAESDVNPVISIHDHGSGGHLNCLSELVEETGGVIDMSALPVGDPSLSAKEIISNESQERMGLLLRAGDVEGVKKIAEREQAPFYVVGEATDKSELIFEEKDGKKPFDLKLSHLFGSAPKTIMEGETVEERFEEPTCEELGARTFAEHLREVLTLEAVGSKDWLINKVDRSVTGKVARQQSVGSLQIPLADLGAVALDFHGEAGVATSIGHAPVPALVDSAAGSRLAIAEALTNLIGAPLAHGLDGVSLSANWMWPARNEGENARLYRAVKACSDFAIELGINIPTGKDSLSMTQNYADGKRVLSPGTLVVSAMGEVSDVKHIVTPVMQRAEGTKLLYIDFSSTSLQLGGSAFYQTLERVGAVTPDVADAKYFRRAFEAVQTLVREKRVLALHDVSAGGIITAVLEMLFGENDLGVALTFDGPEHLLFAENPAVLLQVHDADWVMGWLESQGIEYFEIGTPIFGEAVVKGLSEEISVTEMRAAWTSPSDMMEKFQATADAAADRARNRYLQPVQFEFPTAPRRRPDRSEKRSGVTAAIIRDKGTNGDREMAYALYLAGFDVKDVHMTDLMSGKEDLKEVQLAVFCGGFSHADVLGSAKGWAAGFKYNDKAQKALRRFYDREDTLSLGICNGCQLMAELGLLSPSEGEPSPMQHNASAKFESAFVSLVIPENNSVFLSTLAGTTLGCWVAHGEGRFVLSGDNQALPVAARYLYDEYPGNPNGSDQAIAALSSPCGRHLAMMPHPERSIFPWQCGHYPEANRADEVTPWFELFQNAFRWCQKK